MLHGEMKRKFQHQVLEICGLGYSSGSRVSFAAVPGLARRVRSSHSRAQNNSSNLNGSVQPLPQEKIRETKHRTSDCHLKVIHNTSVNIHFIGSNKSFWQALFPKGGKLQFCSQSWRKGSARTGYKWIPVVSVVGQFDRMQSHLEDKLLGIPARGYLDQSLVNLDQVN